MEMSDHLHALVAEPPVLGGPQSRSEFGGEEKRSCHCPFRELNAGSPARSLVTVLTELPWLLL